MSPSLSSIRVVPAAGPAASGVGKYRYIAELASGGMATVYLAINRDQPDFQKLLVIKELHAELAQDPTFVAMFTDEARLAARLNHPNIVQTYEVGSEGERHFIAMEFLDGVPYVRLARMRADRIPPPIPLHVRVLCEVLYGLHEAHELRDFDGKPLVVVHRDVSPQNVMMTFAGGVKVLDFGIAKAALAVEQRPEDFKGKIEYMAPEQAILGEIDRRADIFAVGVMLWEAIARRRLYEKGEDKIAKLISGEIPDLLTVRPDAPKNLAAICMKAIARNAEDRFATAADMAHELEEWLDGTTQHVKNRDVGAFVTEKFGTIRTKIREAVDAQLTLFKELAAMNEDSPDTLPISKLPYHSIRNDASEPPPAFDDTDEDIVTDSEPGTLAMLEAPALPTDPSPPAHPTPSVWVNESTASPEATLPPATHIATTQLGKRRSPFVLVAIAGSVIITMFFAIGAYVRHRRNTFVVATTTISSNTSEGEVGQAPPPAPPKSLAAEDIDWTVRASPTEAKIVIDGVVMGQNPSTGKRPRDGAMHVVRVEAPGYEAREEQVTFDRSMLITVDLRPVATTPPPADLGTKKNDKGTTTGGGGRPPKPPKPKPVPGLDPESGY